MLKEKSMLLLPIFCIIDVCYQYFLFVWSQFSMLLMWNGNNNNKNFFLSLSHVMSTLHEPIKSKKK